MQNQFGELISTVRPGNLCDVCWPLMPDILIGCTPAACAFRTLQKRDAPPPPKPPDDMDPGIVVGELTIQQVGDMINSSFHSVSVSKGFQFFIGKGALL